MSDTPDHYEVLGVPRGASTSDIERARKRLALVWHPDRNQSADAAERFDEVQKAAEVLRDPLARALYDRDFALRAAMSIPRDLRDRPPEPPSAPADTASADTASADTRSADTRSAGRGPAHGRPRQRRARRVGLWAGLTVLAVVVGIAAVFLARRGPAAPAVPRPAAGPARGGTADHTAGHAAASTQTFSLPQYTPGQAVLPVNDHRVLSVGRDLTLVAADGGVVWHKTARLSALDTNLANSAGPHAAYGCVVDGNTSGRQYDFITLASGQQAVVTEKQAPPIGSMALVGNRVALPDGTIRNPCTGAVLDHAAPSGTFSTVECLIGPVVIGTSRQGQMAWKNGHKLWQRQTRDPLICDGHGSVVKLTPASHKISLINPGSGRVIWTVRDPGCPQDCTTSSRSPVHVLGSGGTVLFNSADQALALARGNGKLLWRKPSQCALAARTKPSPEVLLGACPGQASASTAATGAATVAAATGAVIGIPSAGGNGCGPGGPWAASSHQLLVLCPGPSAAQSGYRAQLMNW